jgi:hypothetical protein
MTASAPCTPELDQQDTGESRPVPGVAGKESLIQKRERTAAPGAAAAPYAQCLPLAAVVVPEHLQAGIVVDLTFLGVRPRRVVIQPLDVQLLKLGFKSQLCVWADDFHL